MINFYVFNSQLAFLHVSHISIQTIQLQGPSNSYYTRQATCIEAIVINESTTSIQNTKVTEMMRKIEKVFDFVDHYMFTTCSLYIFSLYIHYMFTVYSLYIHHIFIMYSLYIHYYIHYMFTIYSLYIRFIFTICSQYIHYISTIS